GILFLIDDRVRRLLGADLVATDAVGAVIVIIFGIVDRAAVIGPDIGAGGFPDHLAAVLAGGEIAQHDVVIFRAGPVGGPGENAVGRVMAGAGKAEILVARLHIAV